MRHHKQGLKLGRTSSHRNAMFRNMVTSLLKHDKIRTTDVKAKEIRRWADRVITLAKRGDLHARRQVLSIVMEKNVVHKLFEEANDRFGAAAGGYTRVVKLGRRPGDAAPMSLVELVTARTSSKDKKKPADEDAKPTAQSDTAPQTPAAAKEEEPTSQAMAAQHSEAPPEVPETQEADDSPEDSP